MYRILVITLFAVILMVSGCADNEVITPDEQLEMDINAVDQTQLKIDIENLNNYLALKGITALDHPTGLKYTIEVEGTGAQPTVSDVVTVKYRGYLTDSDETEFDSNTDGIEFPINATILGWKIGIPLLKEGGKGTLYIPSVYGYGEFGVSAAGIPPNANLVFEVELLDVIRGN